MTYMEQKINPKRILFIITQSEFGGAQRFIYNLLSHLNRSLFEPIVAVGRDGGGEFTESLRNLGIVVYTIHSLRRDIDLISDLKAVKEIRRLIRATRPQTLFLGSSKAGFVGSLAAMLIQNVRVIYRIGGWTFNDPWPKWKKRLWIWLEKLSARWKDIIIVNNLRDFHQAKKLRIRPRKNIVLIHNGIDPYKTNFLSRDEARLKLFELIAPRWGKVFQTKNIIGTTANLYLTKGIDVLIDAARSLNIPDDCIFIVIGSGPEKQQLEAKIKKLDLGKKVFLVGQIPQAARYVPAFDIFVLPSVKEGFPWSILDAMVAKLPVVATNVGAVPEIIEDGKNGFLIEPQQPEAIVDRIKKILDHDSLRQELGIQAHQTVLFKFNLDAMI